MSAKKFVVDANPSFIHPVKVKVPVDGGYVDQQFRARFQIIPVEQAAEFDLENGSSATAFLQRIVVELFDLVDDAEKPVPYSDQLRDQLIANPLVRMALRNAYFGAISGAALGN